MQISHLALNVRDLEMMKDFYVRYFGGRASQRYQNPRTGLQTYFLMFEGSARLELMSWPDLSDRPPQEHAAGYAHLAFRVGSAAALEDLSRRLTAAGCHLISEPRRTGDGYFEVSLLDPEGNSLELVA